MESIFTNNLPCDLLLEDFNELSSMTEYAFSYAVGASDVHISTLEINELDHVLCMILSEPYHSIHVFL